MKRWIKWMSVASIVGIVVMTLLYLKNTNIYQPINIFSTATEYQDYENIKQHLKLTLYSPLGKKLYFTNEQVLSGTNKEYAYINKVVIEISPYFQAHFSPILVTAGKDSCWIAANEFTKTGKFYTANVPIINRGLIAKIASIAYWGPVKWVAEYVLWHYFKKAVFHLSIAAGAIGGLLFLILISRLFLYYVLKKYDDYEKKILCLTNEINRFCKKDLLLLIHNLTGYIAQTVRYWKGLIFENKILFLLIFIVSGCVAVQIISYAYFIKYGLIKYVPVLTFSFYGFFFFTTLLSHLLFHKERATLVLVSTIISFCIMDVALNFFNFNKSVLEQRSGYYLSQYKPLIENWYYTRMKNSEYCLCNLEYAFQRKANNEGLADSTFTTEKRPREIRIIGIGDSFTEGDGTHADSTYLKTTEKLLKTNYPGKDFKFMNAGMCGSDMVFEYQLLKDRLLKYKPDIVLVALNNSDIDDIFVRGGFERFLPNGTVQFRKGPGTGWEFLFAQNYIFRLWATSVLGADWLLITTKKRDTLIPQSFKILKQAVVKFKQLADSTGFKFVLLVHPNMGEWQVKKYRFDMNIEIIKTCSAYHIDVLDALTYYTQTKNIPDASIGEYYWKIDRHHNSKGYTLLGEAAAFELKRVFAADSLLLHSQ